VCSWSGRSRLSVLLGMHLGDGWVGPASRPNRLSFTLDTSYPGIIEQRSSPRSQQRLRVG